MTWNELNTRDAERGQDLLRPPSSGWERRDRPRWAMMQYTDVEAGWDSTVGGMLTLPDRGPARGPGLLARLFRRRGLRRRRRHRHRLGATLVRRSDRHPSRAVRRRGRPDRRHVRGHRPCRRVASLVRAPGVDRPLPSRHRMARYPPGGALPHRPAPKSSSPTSRGRTRWRSTAPGGGRRTRRELGPARSTSTRRPGPSWSTSTATRLIDLGAGHRRGQRGPRRPRRGRGRPPPGGPFSHTCFMVNPYEPYVAVCEALNELPRGRAEADRTVQLGSGGRRERGQDRPARHRPAGRGGVRPRLPRPHQPDHGPDRQEHALPRRVRSVRPRGLPGPHVVSVPGSRRDDRAARPRPGPSSIVERQVGADNVACVLIEPIQGEGGFVVPAPGFLPAIAAWCRRTRGPAGRRRDPDRVLPHRRLVRVRRRRRRPRSPDHGQGTGRRHAPGRGHRSGRPHGRGPPRRSGRHLRRQSGGVCRRPGRHRHDATDRPGRRGPSHRRT